MSTWPQCALRYDGTFAGFLTCVGESFRQKTYPFYFLPPGAEQITLYPLQEIPSDPALARAVYRALETAVSPAFRRMMTYGFLTCLPQRERSLFDLIYLAFHHALPQDPTDDRILLLTRAIGHLVREAEHYRGFVRFADYGGVLVGQIQEPGPPSAAAPFLPAAAGGGLSPPRRNPPGGTVLRRGEVEDPPRGPAGPGPPQPGGGPVPGPLAEVLHHHRHPPAAQPQTAADPPAPAVPGPHDRISAGGRPLASHRASLSQNPLLSKISSVFLAGLSRMPHSLLDHRFAA